MKVTLRNWSDADIAVDNGHASTTIERDATTTVESTTGAIVIGTKPSIREQIEEVAAELKAPEPMPLQTIYFDVENMGGKDLRVILGVGPPQTPNTLIVAYGSQTLRAAGYIELRELGNANPVTEQPPLKAA
jgi:hypothetical protein